MTKLTKLDESVPAIGNIREFASDFHSECIGFEYQVQGLFSEFEMLFQALSSKVVHCQNQQQQWEQHTILLEHRQVELLDEIRQLRTLVDGQSNLLAKLDK